MQPQAPPCHNDKIYDHIHKLVQGAPNVSMSSSVRPPLNLLIHNLRSDGGWIHNLLYGSGRWTTILNGQRGEGGGVMNLLLVSTVRMALQTC
jgi:hypothetical protein